MKEITLYVAIIGYESILGVYDSLDLACDAIRSKCYFDNLSYINEQIVRGDAYDGCWVDSYTLNKTCVI